MSDQSVKSNTELVTVHTLSKADALAWIKLFPTGLACA